MNEMIKYHLGQYLNSEEISEQAKATRKIVLSDLIDEPKINQILEFVQKQEFLDDDTIKVINIGFMCRYGSELYGIGDNFEIKFKAYEQLMALFPNELSFIFNFVDCAVMIGKSVDEIFPVLYEAMIKDTKNEFYPKAESFELIQDSEFGFKFDILLLEKYYQPCDKDCFMDYIKDYKEIYITKEQHIILDNMVWNEN